MIDSDKPELPELPPGNIIPSDPSKIDIFAQPAVVLNYTRSEAGPSVNKILQKCLSQPDLRMFAGIVGILAVIVSASYLIRYPNFTVFSFCLLTALFGLFIISQTDTKIILSPDGLGLPARFFPQLFFRVKRKWPELKKIVFLAAGSPSTEPDVLEIQFHDHAKVHLALDGLTKSDLEKLFLAIDIYCPNAPKEPPFNQVSLGIPESGDSRYMASFTRLWDEELAQRFTSTAFVPLEAGEKLQNGRISVVGNIAFGGLSAIYLVKLEDGRLGALKEAVIPDTADEGTRKKAAEMFAREAKMLLKLDHPRIAKMLDHFVEGGRTYVLMEYIRGQNLRTYIKENGPQTEKTVWRWAGEIIDLIAYLHGQDPPVIHRDLTPDNLILEPDGSLTLIDFGAANNLLGTATGTLVGKQAYLPPEQFRGKATRQSDIYALGGTLHYLLTGQDPEPLAVCYPRRLRPELSRDIERFITSCTQLELTDRAKKLDVLKQKVDNAIK